MEPKTEPRKEVKTERDKMIRFLELNLPPEEHDKIESIVDIELERQKTAKKKGSK